MVHNLRAYPSGTHAKSAEIVGPPLAKHPPFFYTFLYLLVYSALFFLFFFK
jgi:hypothetical protein